MMCEHMMSERQCRDMLQACTACLCNAKQSPVPSGFYEPSGECIRGRRL
jgi:hypothetical protein